HLPWRERDRIEAATNQRMQAQFGYWIGILIGLKTAILMSFPAIMIGSSWSIDPQGPAYLLQPPFSFIGLRFRLICVSLISTAILLLRPAWRRAFQTQLAEEGLLPPNPASCLQCSSLGGRPS